MIAELLKQTSLKLLPAQFCFLISPEGSLEPASVPISLSETCEIARELEKVHKYLQIRRRAHDRLFDEIAGLWFGSATAPTFAQLLYQEVLAPEKYKGRNYHKLKAAEVGRSVNFWAQEMVQINSDEVNRLTKEALILFSETLNDLSSYRYAVRRMKVEDERGLYVLLYDEKLPKTFRKQLALEGVFTRTQYGFLDEEQLDLVRGVHVPRRVLIPSGKDGLRVMIDLAKSAASLKVS